MVYLILIKTKIKISHEYKNHINTGIDLFKNTTQKIYIYLIYICTSVNSMAMKTNKNKCHLINISSRYYVKNRDDSGQKMK
jgi:hypothetical protein